MKIHCKGMRTIFTPESFGDYLRILRGIMPNHTLAKKLKITPSSVCEFETGRGYPSARTIKKWCEICGGNFEEIYLLMKIEKDPILRKILDKNQRRKHGIKC